MVDLTQFNDGEAFDSTNASSGGGSSIEPGRHILHYAGSEEVYWEELDRKVIRITFEIDGTTMNVRNDFCMQYNKPTPDKAEGAKKNVEIGKKSLMLLMNAVGVKSMKNANELSGKSVSAELVRAESGYLDIDEQFGNTWQEVSKVKSEPKVEEKADDTDHSENIPF
jgi:hypothetical protein